MSAALLDPEVPVRLDTARLVVTMPPPTAAPDVLAFFRANETHTRRWDPPRPDGFLTEAYWTSRLATNLEEYAQGRSMRLFLVRKETGRVVGACNFTNIVRGPLQACILGYALDHRHEGEGLMTEALEAAIAFAFDALRLHRIEANHLPTNERSARLLRRLGFAVEGYARDYLFIDGAWRDHVRAALHAPNPGPPSVSG